MTPTDTPSQPAQKDRHCPDCGHRFDIGPDRNINCPRCGTESHPTAECDDRGCPTPRPDGGQRTDDRDQDRSQQAASPKGFLPAKPEAFVEQLTPEQASEYLAHLRMVEQHLDELGNPSPADLKAVNEAAVTRAVELLTEVYVNADEYGEREAEIAAVATILGADLDVDAAWGADTPLSEFIPDTDDA